MLNHIKLEDITEADLQALVGNEAAGERLCIEYKTHIPGKSDEKKKLLAEIVAFANTSGGDLLLGIHETGGIPDTVTGLPSENTEEDMLKLENMIRDGIRPRLPSVLIQPVPLASGNSVLIVRVPKSWTAPHMVGIETRFYGRNSAGKYPLDVDQLRSAFTLPITQRERIQGFRSERIGQIIAGETPVLPLEEGARIVLHLIPLNAFAPGVTYDLRPLLHVLYDGMIDPLNARASEYRFNFDGLVTYQKFHTTNIGSYLQIYRNAILEAVDAWTPNSLRINANENRLPHSYEKNLVADIPNLLRLLEHMEVPFPVLLFISVLNVKGMSMSTARSTAYGHPHAIDRQHLILPDILIDNSKVEIAQALRPIFDMVWNAAGHTHSHNYTGDGLYKPM